MIRNAKDINSTFQIRNIEFVRVLWINFSCKLDHFLSNQVDKLNCSLAWHGRGEAYVQVIISWERENADFVQIVFNHSNPF